jgi:hypothetical protein
MIVIGVLRERFGQWEFKDALDNMRIHLAQNDIPNLVIGQRCTNIFKGRQNIAEKFLKIEGASHLFFIDSDEVFHPHTAKHLYNLDLDIVSGVVYQRERPFAPCVYKLAPQNNELHFPMAKEVQAWFDKQNIPTFYQPQVLSGIPDDESVFEVDEVGTGCLMVKREVFEVIPSPWFWTGQGVYGMTSDIIFCRKARKHRFKIHADFRVQLGHLTTYAIGAADFRRTKEWKEVYDENNQEVSW